MFENVTGVFTKANMVYRLEILAELAKLGYDAEWRTIKGIEFGMAQKRQRAILVGFRKGQMHRFRWPEAVSNSGQSVGEVLHDLMAANGWPHADAWAKHASQPAMTLIGGSKLKTGLDLSQPKSRAKWEENGVNARGVAVDAPGPNCGPADVPGEDADNSTFPKLTLRMLARLQGFDDSWRFSPAVGSTPQPMRYDRCGDFWRSHKQRLEAFHQVTNAFPPRLARAIGLSIRRALTGRETDLAEVLPKPTHSMFSLERLPGAWAEWEEHDLAITHD